jgi:peptide/nickel transport system substrate-binding protein
MRKLLAVLALLLAGALASAEPFIWPDAWTAHPGEAVHGGTLRLATLTGSRTFNPFVSGEADDVLDRSFRSVSLLTRDRVTGGWMPYMAESFTVSEDGLVVEMTLREELRWSDGTPITSADFLFYYTATTDPEVESPRYDDFFIGGEPILLEAPDERTLRWTFPTQDREAFATAASPPAPDHILGEIYREGGAEALRGAWGTEASLNEMVWAGPFIPTLYSPDERYTFARNPHFGDWNVDEAGNPLPYLDGLAVTIASTDAELNLYIAGEIDLVPAANADQLAVIYNAINNGDIDAEVIEQAYEQTSTAFYVFNWNKADDPFKQELFRSADFRKAMSHLTPREALADLVLAGEAIPVYTLITPAYEYWYTEDYPTYEFNPEAALELLAGLGFTERNSAGWLVDEEGNELGFTLATLSGNDDAAQTIQIIADAMRESGVRAETQILEFSLLVDQLLATGETRPFDAIYIFFGGSSRDWPFFDGILLCDAQFHMWNRSGECLDPREERVAELALEGRRTLDDEAAQEIGYELMREFAELQPIIYTTASTFNVTWLSSVRGNHPEELINAFNGPRSLVLTFKTGG